VYAGGAGGGVWKSTDAAHQQWTPLFDKADTMAIGTLAVVPNATGKGYTVYAGTGEPTINLDAYAGVGVLASTDAGASWHRVGGDELQGAGIFKVVATPDTKTLFAATSKGLYRFRSGTDTTWKRVVGDPDSGSVANAQVLNLMSDVAVRPGTNGREIVAVRGWRAGAATIGLYVSYDGGDTFKGPLAPQGYVPAKSQGRASIAYSADGGTLYAMVQDASTFNSGAGQTILAGIYVSKRDVDGPFNQIASPGTLQASGSAPLESSQPFGGDGGATVVDHANANRVMTEYTSLSPAVTADGGRNWTDVTPGDPLPLFIAPIFADRAGSGGVWAGGEFLWNAPAGLDTEPGGWSQVADTGPGHSISALDVRGGKGYAAWCGPCWPGYVSESGFARG
jgi:hypothetical protein